MEKVFLGCGKSWAERCGNCRALPQFACGRDEGRCADPRDEGSGMAQPARPPAGGWTDLAQKGAG